MPYIKKHERKQFTKGLKEIRDAISDYEISPGQLNYLIYNLCLFYLDDKGMNNGATYTILNDIVGVLDNVKFEFQRRKLSPYEDKKIKDNGDVTL